MARITLRQLLDHAAEHGYGVPAFNINNMEQGLAIMDAAAAVEAPVIIQASRGARSYANDIMLSKMIDALQEMYPQIPLCLHQDHGNEEATCATAIKHGFTSVMMDGSLKADAKTAALSRTLRAVRHRGPRRQDQGDPAGGDGEALSKRRARSRIGMVDAAE